MADIDTSRADMHALQTLDAVAGGFALDVQRHSLFQRRARLAAIVAIGDVERIFVGQGRLNARPRAHVDADLFAHPTGERVGRKRQHADESIGRDRSLKRRQILHQRRRVGEVEDPGAAGPPCDHQPPEMLRRRARRAFEGPRLLVAQQMFAPVALNPALDRHEQIGPHRLRAEIAAPDPPGDGVHQEQRHGGDNQEAGQVIDFLRPDLDKEEIETPRREIDQHRLVGRIRAAIPAHERQEIVDAHSGDEQCPFQAPKRAGYLLRIDLLARRIERLFVDELEQVRRDRNRALSFLHQIGERRRPRLRSGRLRNGKCR